MSNEKIEFHAILTKKGAVKIMDQHGREIDGESDNLRTFGRDNRVITNIEMEAPMWPSGPPHVTISIRVPLEVEERLPDWMREFVEERS